jgi:cystathionine beta-lyase
MKYDFDIIYNRNNTNSVKWDLRSKKFSNSDVQPLWVADMDFKSPLPIINKLVELSKRGIFGYTFLDENYYKIVQSWFKKNFNWDIKKEWIVFAQGVMPAINLFVQFLTNPGDSIIIQKPVYYCFMETVEYNERKLINNSLKYNKSKNKYEIDFIDFENKIKNNNVKLFILCSPHNPVARVWTKSELQQISDICKKYNVFVVSDEIHCDIVFDKNKHIPFTEIHDNLNCAVATAPSKTFNIAGLQGANVIIPDKTIRKKFILQLKKNGLFQNINYFIPEIFKIAYTECNDWLEQMIEYVKSNYVYVQNFCKKYIPEIKVLNLEATYLCWLNFSEFGYTMNKLNDLIINKAGCGLQNGLTFGNEGEQFFRINLACQKSVIEKCMNNLKQVF